jgi:hypothetical protein
MKTKLYLAHALTNASAPFAARMVTFRRTISKIPGVELLDFNWTPGKGPDPKIETYPHDMRAVMLADLSVFVLDENAFGVGMEIQERCRLGKPLLCFYPRSMRLTSIIPSCIRYHRTLHGPHVDLADPVQYFLDIEMVDRVREWVSAHQLFLKSQDEQLELVR